MSLLRELLRAIFGTTASSFVKGQEDELLELMRQQAMEKAVYVTDLEKRKAAKLDLIEELSERIMQDNLDLDTLGGK
jgi:hypothetical protein